MKKIQIQLLVILTITLLASCGGDKDDYKITELTLSLDKDKILDDNVDLIMVSVFDQKGENVTSDVDILADGTLLLGREIRSSEAGTIEVYAEHENIVSNNETLTVIEDIGLRYDRMVLIEQFTATWCGYCPRAISAINTASITGEDIVHIAYHVWGSDPFQYSHNSNLANSFGVEGIPAVVAGRELFFWNLSPYQLGLLYKEVRTGFSVSYAGDAGGITATIDVSFGKQYIESLNITAYLIEDNLVADQANYYNDDVNSPWYNLGSTVAGYSHDNVMRQTLTDMYGDPIPSASIDIGSEYTLVLENSNLLIDDLNNSSLVVFVSYGSGPKTDQVINAIVCDFGAIAESPLASK